MQLNDNEKKLANSYRANLINLINDYPINKTQLRPLRNLSYILQKQLKLDSQECLVDIKANLKSTELEIKLNSIKLLNSIRLNDKLKFIDENQAEIINISFQEEYHSEVIAAINSFLLSTYLVVRHNQELYGASISRIISIYTKLSELMLSHNRDHSRNGFEILRSICDHIQSIKDKLYYKLLIVLEPAMPNLFQRLLTFQVRLRCRLMAGFVKMFVNLPNVNFELYDKIIKELVMIMNNLNEYECLIETIPNLGLLMRTVKISWFEYNRLLRTMFYIMTSISVRKQFLPIYVEILRLSQFCNHKLKYDISVKFIEITKHFQSQYVRLVMLKMSLRNLIQISRECPNKKYSIIMSIFNQKWFVSKIKEDHTLFRQEFLMSLVSEYFEDQSTEVKDILDICNRLLDWNCNMKTQSNIQTIKYTFDIFLIFLKQAIKRLQSSIDPYLSEIIGRVNDQNINFLFKMKLLSLLASTLNYEILSKQLKFDFIDGQLRPFMMPKNPKQIFTGTYARTGQGIIESNKEIEYIKNITNLLSILPCYYVSLTASIDKLVVQYQVYLDKLETVYDANKNLINKLHELENQPIITKVSKNFLLSIYKKVPQLTIYDYPFSCQYTFLNDYEKSIFPCNSPVELLVQPYSFKNGMFTFGITTVCHLQQTGIAIIRITSTEQSIQIPLENTIVEILVKCPGIIYVEIINDSGNILAKSEYKLLINWNWIRIDWFTSFDMLKLKVVWKNQGFTAKFLTVYWGEPICISFEQGSTQLFLYVCSRQIINLLKSDLQNLLDYLTEGNLLLNN